MSVALPDRVLVTGGSGRLGRTVVAALSGRGVRVTSLDIDGTPPAGADRAVVGSASDTAVVKDALADAGAVVHLAARPSPHHGTAEEVFCGNTSATFTVLEEAGRSGIRRAVAASSYSATGLPFSTRRRHPAYLPIDEAIPLQVEDPYGLSKQVDEHTCSMMWWRHAMSVVALRFPYLATLEGGIAERAARVAADPSNGASEFWMYLDLADAAEACVLGLTEAPDGCHVVGLAAPETFASSPTEELLERFHPEVPRRRSFPGRMAPIDLGRAASLLGWTARRLWSPGTPHTEPTREVEPR